MITLYRVLIVDQPRRVSHEVLEQSAEPLLANDLSVRRVAVEQIARVDSLTTAAVCEVLGVSRSAFYAWRDREPTVREQRDAELTPLVRAIFWKHRRRYGARRIAEELADLGECCSPRHVEKMLKTQGLRAIQPKSFVPTTTDSRHALGYPGNLVNDWDRATGRSDLPTFS